MRVLRLRSTNDPTMIPYRQSIGEFMRRGSKLIDAIKAANGFTFSEGEVLRGSNDTELYDTEMHWQTTRELPAYETPSVSNK